MSDTRLISLRMPIDLLALIDSQAAREHRSRAQVIILSLSGSVVEGHDGSAVRSRGVPVDKPSVDKTTEHVSSHASPTKTPGHHPRCGCSICKGSAK